MSFVEALDGEIAALEADLAQDVRFVRLRELRRLRSELYADSMPVRTATFPTDGRSSSVPRPPLRKASPERVRALDLAALYLRNRVPPVTTGEIFDHLVAMGVQIGGSNPRNNLSAMLSNSDQFASEGRRGWRLSTQAPPASSGEEAEHEPIDYDAITSDFFLQMTTHEALTVKEYVEASGRLPNGVADDLLVTAEARVNRDLTAAEIRALNDDAVSTVYALVA